MRLKLLEIKNFKGITSYNFTPNGDNAKIFGDNATGKTTLYDAYLWLLFGKNSQNQKAFGIKPYNKDMRNESVIVTATFVEPNIRLSRVFTEKWTKERGNPIEVFSGHTTNYFVNDIAVKESEYLSTINKIINEETFKILSNPLYFCNALSHNERRNTIMGLVEAESSTPDISIVTQKIKSIEKEIKDIPVRIHELFNQVVDLPDGEENLKKLLEEKSNQIKNLQLETNEIISLSGAKAKIAEIDLQIAKIETEYHKQRTKNLEDSSKSIQMLKLEKEKLKDAVTGLMSKVTDSKSNVLKLESEMNVLRKEYKSIAEQKCEIDHNCPTCNQQIPSETYEQTKAQFNLNKSNKLVEIQTQGKSLKAQVEQINKSIELDTKKIDELHPKITEIDKKIVKIQSESDAFKLQDLSTYQALIDKKNQISNEKPDSKLVEINDKIFMLEQEIKNIHLHLAKNETNKSIIKRIDDLKQHQAKLADEYTELSKQRHEHQQSLRNALILYEKKINDKFANVRFKLFEEQINGEMKDVCIVTFKGVDYNDLNYAAKINCGLDIINTLTQHYKTAFPVFIDNAESITDIWMPLTQVIAMYVSESDKTLRIV